MEEIREGFREQGRRMREEMEGLREEYREQVRKWKAEREELKKELEKMGKRLEKLKVERKNYRVGGKEEEDIREGVEERLREIERKVERKKREEQRRNIMIRGLKVKEDGRRRKVEKLLEDVGAKVEVAEVRRIGEDREKGREMVWIRGNKEQKWEVMEKKRKLRGWRERIGEDLT